MMNTLKNKTVAIIGGGPGGLTLARLLEMNGVEVKVYERDVHRTVRVQGATLDLHEESGLEVLKRAGLIDAFYAHHRPDAGKMRVVDKAVKIWVDDHASTEDDSYADGRPEIDRGPLREILLDALQPETVVWDSQFTDMQPEGEGWRIQFKNGSGAYADVVIGAEGVNSNVRKFITDIAPIYSGITIVEGNIYDGAKNAPQLWDLVKGGKVFAFGDEHSLILSAKGDGALSFYTGCKFPEHWVTESAINFSDKNAVNAWFTTETAFGTWDPIWKELFASDEMYVIPRPQYHFPIDQQWKAQANVTMLGDAAHRMPPYAGEGVNMAMQDAYELAECLLSDQFSDLKTAIATFEKGMCTRMAEMTQATLDATEMLHSSDPIGWMMKMFEGGEE